MAMREAMRKAAVARLAREPDGSIGTMRASRATAAFLIASASPSKSFAILLCTASPMLRMENLSHAPRSASGSSYTTFALLSRRSVAAEVRYLGLARTFFSSAWASFSSAGCIDRNPILR